MLLETNMFPENVKDPAELENSIFSKQNTTVAQVSFNGFASNKEESVYNTVTSKLVSLLQGKCMDLLSKSNTSSSSLQTFASKMIKLQRVLIKLEGNRSEESSRFNLSAEIKPLVRLLQGLASSGWSTTKMSPLQNAGPHPPIESLISSSFATNRPTVGNHDLLKKPMFDRKNDDTSYSVLPQGAKQSLLHQNNRDTSNSQVSQESILAFIESQVNPHVNPDKNPDRYLDRNLDRNLDKNYGRKSGKNTQLNGFMSTPLVKSQKNKEKHESQKKHHVLSKSTEKDYQVSLQNKLQSRQTGLLKAQSRISASLQIQPQKKNSHQMIDSPKEMFSVDMKDESDDGIVVVGEYMHDQGRNRSQGNYDEFFEINELQGPSDKQTQNKVGVKSRLKNEIKVISGNKVFAKFKFQNAPAKNADDNQESSVVYKVMKKPLRRNISVARNHSRQRSTNGDIPSDNDQSSRLAEVLSSKNFKRSIMPQMIQYSHSIEQPRVESAKSERSASVHRRAQAEYPRTSLPATSMAHIQAILPGQVDRFDKLIKRNLARHEQTISDMDGNTSSLLDASVNQSNKRNSQSKPATKRSSGTTSIERRQLSKSKELRNVIRKARFDQLSNSIQQAKQEQTPFSNHTNQTYLETSGYSDLHTQKQRTLAPQTITSHPGRSKSRGKSVGLINGKGAQQQRSTVRESIQLTSHAPIQQISINNSHHYNMPITIQASGRTDSILPQALIAAGHETRNDGTVSILPKGIR